MATTTRLTIEDFERLPDDQVHYKELVDGELVDVSGNTPPHVWLRDLLFLLLRSHVAETRQVMSEQEFNFDGNAHGPDVTFLSRRKLAAVDRIRRVQLFVPDLAIEIVSRNDTFEKLMTKAQRYRRCGTSEVWVFSQATRQAFVLSDTRQEILEQDRPFESPLIPGLSIRLGELFDRAA